MLKKLLFIIIFVLFTDLIGYSQETALPFISNYGFYVTGLQEIWCVVKDQRGIMYFAANGGIIEYDGKSWQTITLKNNSLVRALAIAPNGRIYYGASGDFGYIEPDSIGQWQVVSLYKQIDTNIYNEAPAIWRIHIKNNKIYFNGLTAFIIYNPEDSIKKFKIIRPPSKFLFSFMIDTNIIINEYTQGLVIIQDDTIKQIPGSSILKNQFILSVLPYNKDTWLVALWTNLYLFKPDFKNPENSTFELFQTDAQYLFDKYSIYTACKLPDDRFAIGTGTDGVAIIDKNGKLLEYINKNSGLLSNAAISLNYFDNNLWITSYKGISKVELDLPIRLYDERSNINGVVLKSCIAENALFTATAEGVYMLDSINSPNFLHSQKFKQIQTDFYETFAIQPYYDSLLKTEFVIIGQSNGISEYNIKTRTTRLIKDKLNVYSVEQSKLNKDIIFVGSENYIFVLKRNHQKHTWQIDTIKGFSAQIRGIAQYNNNLFLSTFYNGIIVIKNVMSAPDYDKINPNYTIENHQVFGKDTIYNNIFVYFTAGKIYATTLLGLYEYNEQSKTFIKSDFQNNIFSKHLKLFVEAPETGDIFTAIGIFRQDGTRDSVFAKRKQFQIQHIFYFYPRWYLSAFNGIAIYNDSAAKYFADTNKFYSLIRYVKINGDSVIFAGNFFEKDKRITAQQPPNNYPELEYKDNSITFGFAAPYFIAEDSTYFIFKLEVFDKDWSIPTHRTSKEYTNLPEGDYIFKVKAINVFGRTSETAMFNFTVKPPWQRTIWAFILYFILFVALIYIIVKLNSRRLVQAKIKLENIVKERTAEINLQKEELKTQAESLQKANIAITAQKEEIEKVHKKIQESIRYASRIQSAILPNVKILEKYFTGYFVFYRPRDIVSGDFYWIKEVGEYIIVAAADCTGHGVPGAFVSMLGVAFLNEIIRKKEVQSPADILEHLRIEIKSSLKQTGKIDENKDGMDIAVAVINKRTFNLQYAGANNPLFIIRNKELIELKPTRNPVSVFIKEKPFENKTFDLQKNDLIYLFSDGYPDQFDSTRTHKFFLKKFKNLLLSISEFDMHEQEKKLEQTLLSWRGNAPQTDDILVIGIKI